MLTSLAYVLLLGMAWGPWPAELACRPWWGCCWQGILLGPCVLNLLSPSLLGISADLRQLALVIILTRAGLSLGLEDLRRAGRPAVLLCFVPASFEVLGMVLLAPRLLGGWTCWTPPLWAPVVGGRCPPRSSFPGCSG